MWEPFGTCLVFEVILVGIFHILKDSLASVLVLTLLDDGLRDCEKFWCVDA